MLFCWIAFYLLLCWVSLCRILLCWVSLCWVSLCCVSLCWVSWGPQNRISLHIPMINRFQTKVAFTLAKFFGKNAHNSAVRFFTLLALVTLGVRTQIVWIMFALGWPCWPRQVGVGIAVQNCERFCQKTCQCKCPLKASHFMNSKHIFQSHAVFLLFHFSFTFLWFSLWLTNGKAHFLNYHFLNSVTLKMNTNFLTQFHKVNQMWVLFLHKNVFPCL